MKTQLFTVGKQLSKYSAKDTNFNSYPNLPPFPNHYTLVHCKYKLWHHYSVHDGSNVLCNIHFQHISHLHTSDPSIRETQTHVDPHTIMGKLELHKVNVSVNGNLKTVIFIRLAHLHLPCLIPCIRMPLSKPTSHGAGLSCS